MMNNLLIEKPSTLQENYSLLTNEIQKQMEEPIIKAQHLQNLEKAFKMISEDLFGLEEDENDS